QLFFLSSGRVKEILCTGSFRHFPISSASRLTMCSVPPVGLNDAAHIFFIIIFYLLLFLAFPNFIFYTFYYSPFLRCGYRWSQWRFLWMKHMPCSLSATHFYSVRKNG